MPKETHDLYTGLSNKLREDADLFDWFELGATDGDRHHSQSSYSYAVASGKYDQGTSL